MTHLCVSTTAELGDFDEGEHTPGLISEFHFVPHQTEELELAVLERFKTCRYDLEPCQYYLW